MIDSTLVDYQLDTIHRQAKRFAARLKLPITAAKDILAKAFYCCSEWSDLEGRLKSRELDRHIQLLTALPQSAEACLYFVKIRRDLARLLSQHMLTNANLAGLLEHVQEVFAVGSDPITLDDLVPRLKALNWRPAGIGPDSWAVVESEAVVNGTCLRLVGTRTYLPKYYDFGPKHEFGEYAEPFEGKLRIVWTEPMTWYQAALDYLDDLDAEDIVLPAVELTKEMARHQAWFEAALSTSHHIAEYRLGDDDLVPVILEGQNCYVVFGYPVKSNGEALRTDVGTVELASAYDNFSKVVMLHESPICLEWIAYDPKTRKHPGEFDEYFETLRQTILHGNRLPTTPRQDGLPGLLLVRPATDFDIRQELAVEFTHLADEVAFVLKTSNLTLARELLGKVVARDLMVYAYAGRLRYFALFSVPQSDESPELSLSFESESPGAMSMSNLILLSRWKKQNDGSELLVEIAPKLMTLVDRVGKKAIDTAMSHGLVQRFPVEFLAEFERPPANCREIPKVSDEIAKVLEQPIPDDAHVTMRQTRYGRDNF